MTDADRQIRILHLSDIHLGTTAQAQRYFTQLATDLTQNLNVKQLNYLVISGDIADRSTQEEYEAAFELVDKLVKRYGLDPNRIVIVPGNHDLNWDLSEAAYDFVPQRKLSNPLPEGKYISAGDAGALIRDEDEYKKRFDYFSDHFYKKIYNQSYPQEYSQQAILYPCPQDKILFLGLNSCWEIDQEYTDRSGINADAIANALDQLLTGNYDNWLKIAIWHHPVNSSESMKNVAFLEQLAVNGFQLGIHGHIHEAKDEHFLYDTRRGLRIIGAGTFGAPVREQVTGIPLQYNLLTLDPESGVMTVEARKKEKADGAWFADARWSDKNNPEPRYKIELKYGTGGKKDTFSSQPKVLQPNNRLNVDQSIFGGNINVGGSITIGSINQSNNSITNQTENSEPKRKILILASSPIDRARLRLDAEVREIDEGLRRAQKREQFTLEQKWAVRPDDLRRALLDLNPQIVHFSGHGKGERGILLENEAREAQLVPTNALANLFKLFASRGVECVVLNACYAEVQAQAISQHINYVVGMSNEISDRAAVKFAVGFYNALGAGWSYEEAFDMGCSAIALEGIPEELTPVLKKKTEQLSNAGQTQAHKLVTNSVILNLSRPNTNYWKGREIELKRLKNWLDDASTCLIIITAAGGYGKSTLVSKLYEEAIGFYQQFWVSLDQPYRFGQWGRWILKQLGQEFDERLPDEQLTLALVNCLSQKRFLLVLDNLETVLEEEIWWQPYRFFLQALCDSSSHSRVLITSRIKPEGLNWRSEEMPLKGLSEQAGIDFLGTQNLQGSEADLRQLVNLTDCHPLLLKLTVGWLRKKRGKSANVTFILEQQDINLFKDIVGQHRDDPEASIGKMLEQSVCLLLPFLQQLWLDLSVYRRAFGLVQANVMQPEATEENLRELARYALLQEETTETSWEFFFLPLLRNFAQERAGEQTEAHRRAITYYTGIAKPKPWAKLENIASYFEVFYHYFSINEYNAAFQTLYECNEFLYTNSYNSIRVELYEPLLQKWMDVAKNEEKGNIGRALTCLGNAYHALGEYNKAIKYHKLCQSVFQEFSVRGGESAALTHLGNAYQATGQYEQARQCYQEALRIAEDTDDPYAQANALGNMGNVHNALGQYQQAIALCNKSLEIMQILGKRFEKGCCLGKLGNAYMALGDYQQAIEFRQRQLEIVREIGDRRGETDSLGGFANIYQAWGQYEQSMKYRQQALLIAKEVGDRQSMVYGLIGLSDTSKSLENYQQAIEYLEQSLEISQAIQDRSSEARAWLNLGYIFTISQRTNCAISAYYHACELFQTIGLEQQVEECKKAIEKMQE